MSGMSDPAAPPDDKPGVDPVGANGRAPIRVAIVGPGFIARDQATAFASQPDAELVGFVGRDDERTRAVADAFGTRAYTDLSLLIENEQPDALSVCTPTGLHRSFVETAASAGIHVLLEKPMASSVEDCDAMARACQSAGVLLMLGFTHRFHAELITARRLIAEGSLGPPGLAHDLFSFGETQPWPAWYYDEAMSGGGELMHDAVHMIDRLSWLVGSPIVEVFGRTTRYARGIAGVEDGGVVLLGFASGAVGSIFVNQSSYPLRSDAATVPMPGRMELEIHGPRGSLRYRTWHELVIDLAGQPSRTIPYAGGEMVREVREFLDAIAAGRPPAVGWREGRRGVATVHAIYESDRRNLPVLVDELYPVPADLSST
jgi:UDP-N-acetyl-2-amino-2-deoxyglucuronate dehydrogenase